MPLLGGSNYKAYNFKQVVFCKTGAVCDQKSLNNLKTENINNVTTN